MNDFCAYLSSLTVFRGLLATPVAEALGNFYGALENQRATDEGRISAYCELYYRLTAAGYADLAGCLEEYIRYDEGPYPAAVARGAGEELRHAALRDFDIMEKMVESCAELKQIMVEAVSPHLRDLIEDLPVVKGGEMESFEALEEGYRRDGSGMFARTRASIWDGNSVIAVENPDSLAPEEMIGYQWQRQEVIENTRILVGGKRAANILLHGYSGTGKSATIKSLISLPEFSNLRIIEIVKEGIPKLRRLITILAGKPQKFVLFIDDLTFSGDEEGYSALKSVLEGGLGMRPKNVVVYATSNRRHMVRESFSERRGDEVHVQDTIQEKTSLADRFGIRIPYMSLNKAEFLKTVEELALRSGIEMEPQRLHEEANKWEIAHAGRTPRTARQFVDYLAGMDARVSQTVGQ